MRVSEERLGEILDLNESRQSDGEGVAHWLSATQKLAYDRDLPRIIADLQDERKHTAALEADCRSLEMRAAEAEALVMSHEGHIAKLEAALRDLLAIDHLCEYECCQEAIAKVRALLAGEPTGGQE